MEGFIMVFRRACEGAAAVAGYSVVAGVAIKGLQVIGIAFPPARAVAAVATLAILVAHPVVCGEVGMRVAER